MSQADYQTLEDCEGIELESSEPFRFACCDCGLVHDVVITSEDESPVGFAVKRNQEATGERRRSSRGRGPVGQTYTMEALVSGGRVKTHAALFRDLPAGTLLYAEPIAVGWVDTPMFWYRPRSDGGYEGPIHNNSIEDVRKQSGAWVPLFARHASADSYEPVGDDEIAEITDYFYSEHASPHHRNFARAVLARFGSRYYTPTIKKAVEADRDALMRAILKAGQDSGVIRQDLGYVSVSECLHILHCLSGRSDADRQDEEPHER